MKINKDVVYPNLIVNRETKVLTIGRTKYPLIYALCCPFTDYPVMALFKTKKDVDNKDRFSSFSAVGRVAGFTSFEYDTWTYDIGKDDGGSLSASYYYGLNMDNLIEDIFESRDLLPIRTDGKLKIKEKNLETFKEKLLKGKYEMIKMVREVVKGEDVMFAVADITEEEI